MTGTGAQPTTTGQAPGRLAWTAAVLIVVPALVRASVTHTPAPYWDGDPFVQGGPLVAAGPTAFLVLDLIACLGAGLALVASGCVARAPTAMFAIGAAGVIVHIARSPEHVGPGSAWIAAMASGLGVWHLCRSDAVRRALGAAVFGFAVMLVAKGALQYFVEHPQTIEHFRQTRDAFYESRGWMPGSRSAQIYERRLNQPAATGWFGLANVYATFVAAGFVLYGVAGLGAVRAAATRNAGLVLLAGSLACAGGAVMTASKGAWAAAGLGVAFAAVAVLARRYGPARRALPWGTAAVPLVTLGAIMARGMIGERIGELSVLFRSFYLRGAAWIFGDHPVLGVGPGGFKDAYILRRPMLSPEEVTSSHSVLVDWAATLGAFGIVWCGLLLVWGWHAGRLRGALETNDDQDRDGSNTARATVVITALIVVSVSALVEREAATPEGAAMRALGLLAWLALAWAWAVATRRWAMSGHTLGVGATTVILAHTQLDMAAIAEGSAPLAMVWLCALIAPPARKTRTMPPRMKTMALIGRATPALIGAIVGVIAIPRIWAWESGLRDAADPARRVGEARAAMESAASEEEAAGIAFALASDLGVEVPDARGPGDVLAGSLVVAYDRAISALDGAAAIRPEHHDTRVALTKALLQRGAFERETGAAEAYVEGALEAAEGGVRASPGSPSAWMWVGTLKAELAGTPGLDPERSRSLLIEARAAWAEVAARDPHGVDAPVRLMDVNERLGDIERARGWAERALRADTNMRLDELKQLTADERARAERLAGDGP